MSDTTAKKVLGTEKKIDMSDDTTKKVEEEGKKTNMGDSTPRKVEEEGKKAIKGKKIHKIVVGEGKVYFSLTKEDEKWVREMIQKSEIQNERPIVNWEKVNMVVEKECAVLKAIEKGGYLERLDHCNKDELEELIKLVDQLKQTVLIDLPMTLIGREFDLNKPSTSKP